jgi:hypothetical protein
MQMINSMSLTVIMSLLVIFRRMQLKLDIEIDESQITPSDYTICVKNIPKGLQVDYKHELTSIFQNYAVLDSEIEIVVSKVVLVYDIEEVIELEKELDKLIDEKKKALLENKYNNQLPS